ncbi:hypothetical protein HYR99_27280 [Candidatus Poribacteria bacterium]|nr:hypothetical protein [Candidatus Poribacteria bacterium]
MAMLTFQCGIEQIADWHPRLFLEPHEERIAPLLDILGRELEGAVHRISAASCYQKAGDLSRAVNLYRAALAGPLHDDTRQEVEKMLNDCLAQLARQLTVRRRAGEGARH